jgi:branched-chain amino acid transport system ATP-binding protein
MPEPLLQIDALDAFYGDFQALFGVSLTLDKGEILAVIGANGAGKSTLLKSICGLLPVRRDAVRLAGRPVGGLLAHRIAAAGIALVPEGRRLFASLSVEENLIIGGQLKRTGPWSLPRIFELFPVLAEKRDAPAASLSGGQQQMVAIGRALMSNPMLLLCDELSLGLAPVIVKDIYRKLPAITGGDLAIIIIEQDLTQALGAAAHVCCLQVGRVALSAAAADVTREAVAAAYFGS